MCIYVFVETNFIDITEITFTDKDMRCETQYFASNNVTT